MGTPTDLEVDDIVGLASLALSHKSLSLLRDHFPARFSLAEHLMRSRR
jgi:hypothetical protein